MTIVKPEPDRPSTADPMSAPRTHPTGPALCAARRKDGEPCGQIAFRGLERCRHHAGVDLTTARLQGLANIGALVPLAIEHLADTIADPKVPEPVRLAAAKIILDAGLDPRMGDVEARVKAQHVQMLLDAFAAALGPLDLRPEEQEAVWNRFAAEIRRYEEATDDE